MKERILNDKYAIQSVIGSGGMSIVYKGNIVDTGEQIAVKMLRTEYLDDEAFIRRFYKEASIAGRVNHKNIVKTMDVGQQGNIPYIVMEYVGGKTLKSYIEEKGVLDFEEAVDIAVKICDALFYAHSHRLIHQDVKPQNVLLGDNGTVKVADFGIAKIANSATLTLDQSQVIGSVHYISPEQARGDATDEKSDIYSMGIVLYEMVTGKVPFHADTPVSVALKHIQEEITPPTLLNPQIPPALEEIIIKATSKQKEQRYDNAREFARDLQKALVNPEGGFVVFKKGSSASNTEQIAKIKSDFLTNLANLQATDSEAQPQVDVQKSPQTKKKAAYMIARLILLLILAVGFLVTLFLIGMSIYKNSIAPEKFAVPQLQGLSREVARDKIAESGFQDAVIEQKHQLVTEGLVIKQSPLPSEMLEKGGVVTIYVSIGPEKGLAPNLVNMNLSDASHVLEEAGFLLGDVNYEVSDLPKDYVIRQDPQADTELPLGEKISIWISKPADFSLPKMPAVIDMSLEQATEYIAAMGYAVGQVVYADSNLSEGTVVRQQPEPEAELSADDVVILWVSNGTAVVYKKDYNAKFTVSQDSTKVKIVFVDGGNEKVLHESVYNKGSYEEILQLSTATLGEKQVLIYLNNVEYFKDRVTFRLGE